MNYPVWAIEDLGGSTLIAIISIFHVFVAHLAVGGGLYIWLLELRYQRTASELLRGYLYRYTWFFLLVTMVFGGLTGVGIWFIISLVSPQATSLLIHTFVFGWAIEWVFFVGEIVSLLVYYYKYNSLGPKHRVVTAFLYFLFAWLSLVVINGILSFMLTPGKWIDTKEFWDGFLNPTYLPSTLFRSFYAMIVSGIFGLVTSTFEKERGLRDELISFSSRFILYSVPPLVITGIWYYNSVSETIRTTTFVLNPESAHWVRVLLISSGIMVLLAVLSLIKRPNWSIKLLALVLIPTGIAWLSGFEYLREMGRKPYLIYGYMYSNSLLKEEQAQIKEKGLLSNAKWISQERVGEGLFRALCLPCHTWNGPNRPLSITLKGIPQLGIHSLLVGQGKTYSYMPPLYGRPEELLSLARYLHGRLSEKEEKNISDEGPWERVEVLGFHEGQDYVLLTWPDLGIHCMTDMDRYFSILPPGNTIEAILIKRGPQPQLVREGVKIIYEAEKEILGPSKRSHFWKYSKELYGKELKENLGLTGTGLNGEMSFDDRRGVFSAKAIPVVPYTDSGRFMPYPIFRVKALESSSSRLLAETLVVVPVSTEVGCMRCHGGSWGFKGKTGLSQETAVNILTLHDKRHRTGLLKEALEGRPKACSQCHGDLATGMKGLNGLLGLSASIHGFHALYMPFKDQRACESCHPSGPESITKCFRGLHSQRGLVCVDCHGSMEEHALGLLKNEGSKPKASLLMNLLSEGAKRGVEPRRPWMDEPDCLDCHRGFGAPEIPDAPPIGKGRLFRESYDEMGIPCMACHGPTHALYPASNPFGEERDNLQPLQYTGRAITLGAKGTCKVCHRMEMEDSIHHPNTLKGKGD